MLNAVGIDVSKGKSTVAILRPAGEVVRKPFSVSHSVKDLSDLVSYVGSLDGETKVVMEATGHYHEPVLKAFLDAGIFVSAVNPSLMPGRSANTPLISGSICVSIQLWIPLENN